MIQSGERGRDAAGEDGVMPGIYAVETFLHD